MADHDEAMRPAGFLRTTGEVTFEPIAPERAHREGDQPLPTAGKHDVLAELATTVPPALAARRAIGIRRYGRPLETWNGRDVHQDLDDELLDALAYSRQARLERRDLEAEVARLRAELDNERSTREALDARIAALKSELARVQGLLDRAVEAGQEALATGAAAEDHVERLKGELAASRHNEQAAREALDEAIRERDALRRVVD